MFKCSKNGLSAAELCACTGTLYSIDRVYLFLNDPFHEGDCHYCYKALWTAERCLRLALRYD